jgi:uncharacterized C2H2 Zn-finger protein
MTNTTLFSSLERFLKQRRTLDTQIQRLAHQERQMIEKAGGVLPALGYRLVSANGQSDKSERSQTRTRALPKTLKCPRCDRRFSLRMHVARHLSAMHGRGTRGRRKRKVA